MARFSSTPETFFVEEVAAYEPAGTGEHTFCWIEKRDLTTPEAVRRMASVLDVPEREIGYAGLKDRHATTRQWLSLPRVEPDRALGVAVEGLTVIRAVRHGNKLRTGHLRGNRFEVVLEEVGDQDLPAIADRMAMLAAQGLPNRYGEQRFGRAGDSAHRGVAILRGERRERDRRARRLLLSAAQSAVFNRVLDRRLGEPGGLCTVLAGDVLMKTDSGGAFISTDPDVDQPRVDAGEVVPSGPMPGGRELEPAEGSPARALEDAAFADLAVTRAEFAAAGRELPGTRRPLVVPFRPGEPPTERLPGARLRLRFFLPSGSYATVAVAALLDSTEGRNGGAPPTGSPSAPC